MNENKPPRRQLSLDLGPKGQPRFALTRVCTVSVETMKIVRAMP